MYPIIYLLAIPISIIFQILILISKTSDPLNRMYFKIIFMVLLGLLCFLLLTNIIGLSDMIILAMSLLFVFGPYCIFSSNPRSEIAILNFIILPIAFYKSNKH